LSNRVESTSDLAEINFSNIFIFRSSRASFQFREDLINKCQKHSARINGEQKFTQGDHIAPTTSARDVIGIANSDPASLNR